MSPTPERAVTAAVVVRVDLAHRAPTSRPASREVQEQTEESERWAQVAAKALNPETGTNPGTRLARAARFGFPMRVVGQSIEKANILSASIRA
jgi:hypothetical protein